MAKLNLSRIVSATLLATAKVACESWTLPEKAKETRKGYHGACRGRILRAVLSEMPDATLAKLEADKEALARVMVKALSHCDGLRDPAGCLAATVEAWGKGKTPSAIPNGPAVIASVRKAKAKEAAKAQKAADKAKAKEAKAQEAKA